MTIRSRDAGGRAIRSINTAREDAEAAQMRAEGMTLAQIAKVQGRAISTVHARIERAIAAVPVEAVERLRALELERLDMMWQAAIEVLRRQHVTVSDGRIVKDDYDEPILDDDPILRAMDRLLKIQDRRAKLLGLDAPTRSRMEVVTHDAFAEAMRTLEAEVGDLESQLGDRSDAGGTPASADAAPEAAGT